MLTRIREEYLVDILIIIGMIAVVCVICYLKHCGVVL